jgi:hypothetical protein
MRGSLGQQDPITHSRQIPSSLPKLARNGLGRGVSRCLFIGAKPKYNCRNDRDVRGKPKGPGVNAAVDRGNPL